MSVTRPRAPRLSPDTRREQALDAALALIAKDGYGAVTMESVAREMGVTKPVVYDAFPNRGELLRALLERQEGRALAELAAALPQELPRGGDPDALWVQGMTAFLRAVQSNPDTWRLILMPADGTPEVVRRHVEEGRRAALDRIEQVAEWGLVARGGTADLDPELTAHAILALAEHAGRLVITEPERYPPERMRRFVARLAAAIG
jgi:AcrR family transcriptional regulator